MTTITVENGQSIQAAINVSHNVDVIFAKAELTMNSLF